MNRRQETTILRLWRDWCRLWPEQYGHNSLQVTSTGYDPVFDVIPCQAYKDFYHEVIRRHPQLRHLNPFEVIDTALNQVRAPETTEIDDTTEEADENYGYAVELDVVRNQRPEPNLQHKPQPGNRHTATVTPLSKARKAKSA